MQRANKSLSQCLKTELFEPRLCAIYTASYILKASKETGKGIQRVDTKQALGRLSCPGSLHTS